MKKYEISLHGCDDSTHIEINLTKKEKEFVDKLCVLSEENSRYGCCPTMEIELLTNKS